MLEKLKELGQNTGWNVEKKFDQYEFTADKMLLPCDYDRTYTMYLIGDDLNNILASLEEEMKVTSVNAIIGDWIKDDMEKFKRSEIPIEMPVSEMVNNAQRIRMMMNDLYNEIEAELQEEDTKAYEVEIKNVVTYVAKIRAKNKDDAEIIAQEIAMTLDTESCEWSASAVEIPMTDSICFDN